MLFVLSMSVIMCFCMLAGRETSMFQSGQLFIFEGYFKMLYTVMSNFVEVHDWPSV